MSLGARLVVATVSGLFGVMMILIAPPDATSVFFYGFGAFCLLITVASLASGRLGQFCGSAVGTTVFLTSLAYLGHEIMEGPWFSGRRSEPSVLNAIGFMVIFGLPGVAYAFHARFGFRKEETGDETPQGDA